MCRPPACADSTFTQVFAKFRTENDKLAKALKKLEQENTELKKKARGEGR